MIYKIEMEESELELFLEWKRNRDRDLYRKAEHSYIWDAIKRDWVVHKHTFNNKYGLDIMSDELLKILGHKREQAYKQIPNDPSFKLGEQ